MLSPMNTKMENGALSHRDMNSPGRTVLQVRTAELPYEAVVVFVLIEWAISELRWLRGAEMAQW